MHVQKPKNEEEEKKTLTQGNLFQKIPVPSAFPFQMENIIICGDCVSDDVESSLVECNLAHK